MISKMVEAAAGKATTSTGKPFSFKRTRQGRAKPSAAFRKGSTSGGGSFVFGSTRPSGMIPQNSCGSGIATRQAGSDMICFCRAVEALGSWMTATCKDLAGGGGGGGIGPGSGSSLVTLRITSWPVLVA